MYIARDKDGSLYLYEKAPIKEDSYWDTMSGCIELDTDLYPEIMWENTEPTKLDNEKSMFLMLSILQRINKNTKP